MKKLMIAFLILTSIFGCTEKDPPENLQPKVDSLQLANDSLTKMLTDKKQESNYWYNPKYDGAELIENGIEDPTKYIEEQLRQNPELIPLEAVLGGNMRFGKIQILSKEWLIADFDDGHIYGKAIYGYKLNAKGSLEFNLLHSSGPE